MKLEFKVCVIINSLNRPDSLSECIKSIVNQSYVAQIIVVDDGSNPPIQIGNHNVELVRIPRNIGVSRSRNIGALLSLDHLSHLFYTDDDIVLHPNCIRRLCDSSIWGDSYVGAVGGSVLNMNDKEKVNRIYMYNCHPMTIDRNGRITDLSEFWVDEDRWWSADHLRGGNQLIRRDVFFEVGGFNWVYGPGGFREETDFCLELKKHGYKLWFNPAAKALHFKLPYGGVREHIEKEPYYDKIFRARWAPLSYLAKHIEYPEQLVREVGKR